MQAAIAAAKENARTLRALISTEMWLQINVFHGHIRALSGADLAPDRLSAVCAMLKEGAQAHVGISEGTFYRDQCWHFTMIGRYLERADQTTRLLDTRFNALVPRVDAGDPDIDAGKWHALLRAAGGYHAYRREHPHGYRPVEVAGFLLANTAFPRAVALNLSQIEWHLTQLRLRYHLRGGARALERRGQSVRVADARGRRRPGGARPVAVPRLDAARDRRPAWRRDRRVVRGVERLLPDRNCRGPAVGWPGAGRARRQPPLETNLRLKPLRRVPALPNHPEFADFLS